MTPDKGGLPRASDEHGQPPLSKAHIRPQPQWQVKFWLDGSRMTVEKPKLHYKGKHICGDRGEIVRFSKQSRRRLMYKLSEISCKVLPNFVTLTYPEQFTTDPVQWKTDFNNFWKRLKRQFPDASCVWKLEPQKRGAPHYHLLVWGCDFVRLRLFVPMAWYQVVGSVDPKHLYWHQGRLGHGNTHCVTKCNSWRGVMAYASKYLGKFCDCEGWQKPGRFWGVKSRDQIPWASLVRVCITQRQGYDFIRLMRRYAKLPTRSYKSLTIFCNNPEYWFDRVDQILKSP